MTGDISFNFENVNLMIMVVEPRFDFATARVGGRAERRMNSSRRVRISQLENEILGNDPGGDSLRL